MLKHLLALVLCILHTAAVHAAPHYHLTVLPTGTNPTGLNNLGQVVGDIATPEGRRGFLWSAGTFELIGTLGGSESTASAINASGQVVGYAGVGNGAHAYLYERGALHDLGVFAPHDSFATAINDAGQVAGQYINARSEYAGFLHVGGRDTDVGNLGGGLTYVASINNRGDLIGTSALDDSPYHAHAFLYANGRMNDLGTLGGSYSSAFDINDAGQIVGHAWGNGGEHAFFYQNGSMTDIGTLGGRRSFAVSVNAAGVAVGYADIAGDAESQAFIYRDGVLTNLNTLIDPALGWTLYSATGINDAGQIVGYGCHGDECGAVLLNLASNAPEPEAYGMMLTGLGLLGWRARRYGMAL